jgi:four helix bundle protein
MAGIIKEKSFGFALRIVRLYKYLIEEKKEFILSKQMLSSGTSVGANVRESQNDESKMDFIHKLAIAQKECDETMYWLELLHQSNYLTTEEFNSIYEEAEGLLKMIRSSIITSKKSLSKKTHNP